MPAADWLVRQGSRVQLGARVSQLRPHGPAWRGSARCEAMARKNQRLCLRCHIVQTAMACDG